METVGGGFNLWRPLHPDRGLCPRITNRNIPALRPGGVWERLGGLALGSAPNPACHKPAEKSCSRAPAPAGGILPVYKKGGAGWQGLSKVGVNRRRSIAANPDAQLRGADVSPPMFRRCSAHCTRTVQLSPPRAGLFLPALRITWAACATSPHRMHPLDQLARLGP